jgi:hypothetical protein
MPARTRAFRRSSRWLRAATTATGRAPPRVDCTELADVDDLAATALHDLANAAAAAPRSTSAPPTSALPCGDSRPHRLHEVATIDGVRYVDDSKATNVPQPRRGPQLRPVGSSRATTRVSTSRLRAARDHVRGCRHGDAAGGGGCVPWCAPGRERRRRTRCAPPTATPGAARCRRARRSTGTGPTASGATIAWRRRQHGDRPMSRATATADPRRPRPPARPARSDRRCRA